jgi:hypothetical protein
MLADLRRNYVTQSGMVFDPIPTVDEDIDAIARLEQRLDEKR